MEDIELHVYSFTNAFILFVEVKCVLCITDTATTGTAGSTSSKLGIQKFCSRDYVV